MTHEELIAALEGAEGPSRELDAEIAAAQRYGLADINRAAYAAGAVFELIPQEDGSVTIFAVEGDRTRPVYRYSAPAYTASVDAALTLATPEMVEGGNLAGLLHAAFWQGRIGDVPDDRLALHLAAYILKARGEG